MKNSSLRALLTAVALGATMGAFQASAQMVNLYVGIDNREILTYGAYAGLPNPNMGKLTLLYSHHYPYGRFQGNHYHGIGSYSYTGDIESATETDTSGGNAIPEVYTELPGNALVVDPDPLWAEKLISKKTADHYSDMRFRSVHSLASFGPGSSEHFMFHSSAGTRTAPLTDALIALELVSISEGLAISDSDGDPILAQVGDRQVIGDGNDVDFEYLPVFWVDDTAAPGDYQAEFRLVDVNTDGGRAPFPASGRFFLKFRVPEAPELVVTRTVTLTLPLVTDGWELVTAPAADGPWSVMPFPPAPDTTHSQPGTTYDATLFMEADHAFYQLRRVVSPVEQ